MPRITETARERELFRYYQPVEIPKEHTPGVVPVPKSSSDLSLTAFAQLGALRMNAKRGIISLVGRHTEYIIAEAGRSLSLQDDSRHDVDDHLWHGVGALKTKAGVGPIIIDLLAGISQPPVPYVVVNDLTKDDRFKHLPMVIDEPQARFLACLPLRTKSGYVIGLYVIVDDKVRNSLAEGEMQFLEDMAQTVMNQIEAGRVKQKHHRAEKMVKALGLYLEGGESLRNWWITQGQDGGNIQQSQINAGVRRGETIGNQADREFGIQDSTENSSSINMYSIQERYHKSGSLESSNRSVIGDGRPQAPESTKSFATTHTDPSATNLENAISSTLATSIDPVITPDIAEVGPDNVSGKKLQEALLSMDLKNSFSRASNLIREALDVDGVTFFDASIGSFGGGSQKANMNEKAPGAHVVNGEVETTNSSSDTDLRQQLSESEVRNAEEELQDNYASVLGYSTRTRSSFNCHMSTSEQRPFAESLLRRLTKRYPHGKVFNFEEDGAISSSDSDIVAGDAPTPSLQRATTENGTTRQKTKRMSREAEAAAILMVIPGARSVAWFPLWDSSLERWYAGALVWSTTPIRVLSPDEDLTYMATFGNSIMAEVSRMSALLASQMKVDFISSISHELRSPLHGILASVEFLEDDSSMTATQADMINTIHSCGKTLLELIDHVLDFAKINRKLKEKRTQKHTAQIGSKDDLHRRRRAVAKAEVAPSLCVLSEEVIESVYAGHYISSTVANARKPNTETDLKELPVKRAPIVVMDFKYHKDWNFEIDVGAWKRILMNLFSNALKYTDNGFVQVAMNIENDQLARDGTYLPRLSLTVKDSGKGISQEFLKNHIYTAFKQENSLAVGTGLGLSIVRQIVMDLDGRIDIKSDVGAGTQAYLSLPLKKPSTPASTKRKDPVRRARSAAQGLKACIVNEAFDLYPDISDTPTGILSPKSEALILLKASVRNMMTDWFGMDVVTSSELNFLSADIHVTMASEELEYKIQTANQKRANQSGTSIVIVLCTILTRSSNYITEDGLQVVYLQQPASPQKFALILYDAICQSNIRMPSVELAPTPGIPQMPTITPTITPMSPVLLSPHAPPLSSTSKTEQEFDRSVDVFSNSGSPPSSRKIERRRRPVVARHSSDKSDMSPGSLGSSESAEGSITREALRVLLVEDNEINLKLLATCMKRLNYNYVTAMNGLEGVEAYKAVDGHFDIILIDIQMPIMDGFQATREIRRFESDKGLKPTTVVALTGASSMAAKQQAFSSGIDRFLTKPVAMKMLKVLLQNFRSHGREGIADI